MWNIITPQKYKSDIIIMVIVNIYWVFTVYQHGKDSGTETNPSLRNSFYWLCSMYDRILKCIDTKLWWTSQSTFWLLYLEIPLISRLPGGSSGELLQALSISLTQCQRNGTAPQIPWLLSWLFNIPKRRKCIKSNKKHVRTSRVEIQKSEFKKPHR